MPNCCILIDLSNSNHNLKIIVPYKFSHSLKAMPVGSNVSTRVQLNGFLWVLVIDRKEDKRKVLYSWWFEQNLHYFDKLASIFFSFETWMFTFPRRQWAPPVRCFDIAGEVGCKQTAAVRRSAVGVIDTTSRTCWSAAGLLCCVVYNHQSCDGCAHTPTFGEIDK